MRLGHPSTARIASIVAIALTAAACSDRLTTPDAREPAAPRASVGAADQPLLHPNRTRYRYAGEHPATGRSGSATLYMLTLLGSDGVTEVMLSTGPIDEPWSTPLGTFTHALTRASSPDGEPLFTRTHNGLSSGGTASLVYTGLTRGDVVEVRGNVKGIDPNRTDVVTVAGTVLLRPNLAVTELSAPERARAGTPTVISATIRETNGDVGNWATCTLYVDGVQVDAAYGIWVDAGDAVSCAFTHTFQGDGAHAVEVRVEPVAGAPRDDDPADNAATATVESFTANVLSYEASASHTVVRDSMIFLNRWTSPASTGETFNENVFDVQTQRVDLFASVPVTVSTATPRFEITELTGGTTILSSGFDLDGSSGGDFCASAQDAATGGRVFLCSYQSDGFTSLNYVRQAGRVTYHSRSYSRVWNAATGETYVYSENVMGSGSGILASFGSDFAMQVRLIDGAEVFTADPAFPLFADEVSGGSPYGCSAYADPEESLAGELCGGTFSYTRNVFGGATSN